MNELKQKYIDSREVSEMVVKSHKNLIRDIRVYTEQLNRSKIEPVEFFKESTYKDGKGEDRPCYLVTKKGCEFIAHKLTGVKGAEFTAKYIERFHEMQDIISTSNLSPELKAIIMHDVKIVKMEKRMDKLEYDIPLYGSESDELSQHVRRKGVDVMGGKNSNAYNDKEVRSKVYRDIYDQLKREFGIYADDGITKSYKALKRKYLYDAHEFIDCYQPSAYLIELISDANAQICF